MKKPKVKKGDPRRGGDKSLPRTARKAAKEGPGHMSTPRLMPRSRRIARMEKSDISV